MMTIRWAAAGLFALGLTAGAAQGQAKIALNDPAEAEKDPDFRTQGEYAGDLRYEGTTEKLGAQVVALGDGNFDVHLFRGGLPGAGWDKETKLTVKAKRDGTEVRVEGTGPDGSPLTGTIRDGKLSLRGGSDVNARSELSRVTREADSLGKEPPEGAVVLFDGTDASEWQNGKTVEIGGETYLGVGTKSKRKFGDAKIHVEFRLAYMPKSRGQGRSNSGVYIQDRYECQVLDSFGLKGADNECGGFYKQAEPAVNMCLPPLQWQVYEIDFTAARFDEQGNKVANARATVYHNGVKIHDDTEFTDATAGGQKESPEPGPIQLQNHGDPVVYRNVWVLPKE